MDFSTDGELMMDSPQNSDHGLEIEMVEDDSEFELDFSSEIQQDTSIQHKTETTRPLESISPMDLEFSTDEDDNEFDDDEFDTDEELIQSSNVTATAVKSASSRQSSENKMSLNKSDSQQTTLGGHLIKSGNQNATLFGDKPNLFDKNPLFENKKKISTIGKFIFIFLFLVFVAITGYATCIMTGIKIPYISDIKTPYISDIKIPYIEKIPYIDKILPQKPEPIKLTPDQKTVTSKFITNTISGKLFFITGNVINNSKISCKDIKIKGSLLSANKLKVKEKIVICGNIISEDQLKTLDMNAINSILYSSDGNKKFTVESGQSIPFMIVFSDFPDNLENFTVTVTGFERITDKK
ncbi:MAG: DUF3426 domain-containing protein [Desulfamplus sp.]|nr:DUF3426 domain-containing protein [Desulfamplus sp.]